MDGGASPRYSDGVIDYLHVRGLALLDDVALELGSGMNVLTGETGAGKSIIVDALALVRGARGRGELVREGADSARVQVQFALDEPAKAQLAEAVAQRGLTLEDDDALVIERVISASGRGRSRLQSSLTTQAVLAEVGELLIDICSQHEHHSLTRVARHLDLLDAFAGHEREREAVAEAHARWRAARKAAGDLRAHAAEGDARADFLRFQIEELERIDPSPGEYAEISERLLLLRDAAKWEALAREAQATLYESDDAVAAAIANLAARAERGRQVAPVLGEIADQLATAQIACEEAARMAASFADELESEPGELDAAEVRMDQLERLRRKHGVEVDDLLERLEQMRAELHDLDHAEDRLAEYETTERATLSELAELADGLHEKRQIAARGIAEAIETELAALHMPSARLSARVEAQGDEALSPTGRDKVEFLFSANAGEPLAPLARVASGGELSRVLLAAKGVLSTGDRVATYVFDEVDAGVGGAVAESIGQRLHRAARQHQVLCITHLPQIAAFADVHFKVEKRDADGRTVTRVRQLDHDERVEELARMLGGAKVTASARDHARALLEVAREPAKSSRGRSTGSKNKATKPKRSAARSGRRS